MGESRQRPKGSTKRSRDPEGGGGHDRRGGGRSAEEAILAIVLAASPSPTVSRLAATVESIRLFRSDGGATTLPTRNRTLEIDTTRGVGTLVSIPVHPGAYRALAIRLRSLGARRGEQGRKSAWATIRAGRLLVWRLPLELRAGARVRVDLEVDADLLLARPSDPRAAVRVRLHDPIQERGPKVAPEGGLAFEFRLASVASGTTARVVLTAPAGAFPPETRVTLEEPGPEVLPPLFRRQRAVGPVIQLVASERARAPMEVTLPYDESLVAATGRAPEDLVILALDDRRRVYRELRPIRIDRESRTLTVRTPSLSYLFPGTPGIEIDHPVFQRSPAGEVFATSPSTQALVSGHALDERAIVTCPQAAGGWTRLGWFVWEGIPLARPAANPVRLLAKVDGLAAHELELAIWPPPPAKLVTDPARLYGTSLAVSDGNVPFVGAVINQSSFRQDPGSLLGAFAEWQSSFDRPAPYVYRYDTAAGVWRFTGLLPDTYLENVTAEEAIETLDGPLVGPIPVNPAHPEETRALRSLHDFFGTVLERGEIAGVLLQESILRTLELVGQTFGAGNYSYSPALPLLTVSDDEVEVGFVAATAAASREARLNPMQDLFREHLSPQLENPDWRSRVHAGTLFYGRARSDGTADREVVADRVWCATVALRRHPQTGRPFLLALALEPPAGEEPRTRLTLFERRAPGDWTSRTVSADLPVFDADFTFLPDGTPRVVASQAGSRLDKPHLVFFEPDGEGWRASPLAWRTEAEPEASDLGAFPRVVADGAARIAVGFLTPVLNPRFGQLDLGSRIRWMLAVPDEAGWLAVVVGQGSEGSLTGERTPTPVEGFAPGFRGQSARGSVAFAPALLATGGEVHFAFGNGALMLAAIDRATLDVVAGPVDVDRRTGFAPSLAPAAGGARAIAYKDDFGPGDTWERARDQLHFFTTHTGTILPERGFAVPRAPSHEVLVASAEGFAPYERLVCERLLNPRDFSQELVAILTLLILLNPAGAAELIQRTVDALVERKRPQDLVTSILLHRRMHVEIIEGGPEREVGGVHWRFYHSHPELNGMIDRLAVQPRILQLTVDNSEKADEDIERIDVAFIDPLGTGGGEHGAELDAGRFPAALRDELIAQGFRMSRAESIGVRRILAEGESADAPGREWAVTDQDPFGQTMLLFPSITDRPEDTRVPVGMRYTVRRRDDGRLEFRIDPLLTITDRAWFRDRDQRHAPCGVAQFWWDFFGRELAGELRDAVPDIGGGIPGARRVRISNARISLIEPARYAAHQQGAVVFTLTAGQFFVKGRDPDHFDAEYQAFTKGPSEFHMAFAPFVDSGGALQWWAHAVEARLGELEVDVLDWGDLEFLRVLVAFIPLLGGLGVIVADAILDDTATDRAQAQVRRPGIGAFRNLLLRRFAAHVGRQIPAGAGPFEAAFLNGWNLSLLVRPSAQPGTRFNALPALLNLGTVRIGEPADGRRNLLLTNDGALPVALEEVRFDQETAELGFTKPQPWPRVLRSGESEIVGVEFAPALPAGERRNAIRVRFAVDREVDPPVAVVGIAAPPRRPVARLEPDLLQFGVILAGQQAQRGTRVFNDGDADLDVTGVEIQAEPNAPGVFSTAAGPVRLAPGGEASIVVTYAPPVGFASSHRSVLRVRTSDPERPALEAALFGQTAAPGLLVDPLQIAFNPSPLADALPPGLGAVRGVNVYNTGAAPLTIAGASLAVLDTAGAPSPHFALVDASAFPPPALPPADRAIQPGGVFPLSVQFRPQAVGIQTGQVRLTATDPAVLPVTVQITGEGVA